MEPNEELKQLLRTFVQETKDYKDLQVLTHYYNDNGDDDDDKKKKKRLDFQTALYAPIINQKLRIRRDSSDDNKDQRQQQEQELNWPAALCFVHSVEAVQKVLQFCTRHNVKVSVRSGGQCWHGSWLKQGSNSIVLDVSGLNTIDYNPPPPGGEGQGQLLSVGPGSKGLHILQLLEHQTPGQSLFFPCGHCPTVSVGGFILGGGYGLGFTRYGMTCMLVESIEAVLASGEIIETMSTTETTKNTNNNNNNNNNTTTTTDPTTTTTTTTTALMELLRGSHACFPAVITKFNFSSTNLPCRPEGLLIGGKFVFELQHYSMAMTVTMNLQCRSDYITLASRIETTLIFDECYAIVAVTIWADTISEGYEIWNTCQTIATSTTTTTTAAAQPLSVTSQDQLQSIAPSELPPLMGSSHPAEGGRYEVVAHTAGPEVYTWTDDELAHVMEPIFKLWNTSNDGSGNKKEGSSSQLPPPSPSHTYFCPLHPDTQTHCHGNQITVSGFTPAITIMSYAVYTDPEMDEIYEMNLKHAHARMAGSSAFYTEIPEGQLLGQGPESAFQPLALTRARTLTKQLDPQGLFHGFG